MKKSIAKRIISLLLTLILVFSCASGAFAADRAADMEAARKTASEIQQEFENTMGTIGGTALVMFMLPLLPLYLLLLEDAKKNGDLNENITLTYLFLMPAMFPWLLHNKLTSVFK